jgi:5'-phosphate synthase pdxT subunit
MLRVGVMALQGAFEAHLQALSRLGHHGVEVRDAAQLTALDGLIFPGGESTTQLKLIRWGGLEEPLSAFIASGRPVLATCAGVILAAREVRNPAQQSFGWLDLVAERNSYGRQLDSFEARGDGHRGGSGLPLVFIRAPRIVEVGPSVEVLETLDGEPVFVRQGALYGACFHPELSDDLSLLGSIFSLHQQAA